ncbi:MAG: MBL fold metallo-hydrolase [Candidatus Odinarchaeota archaeon]
MNIDGIEVSPLAAESLGVRSLCTLIRTPDVSILFDPSAALAKRYNLEPHPAEYLALQDSLERIRTSVEEADIISISHYHYDHVRPGFTNYLYNFSTQDERKQALIGKVVFAKDNRENINSSQRRRAFFFQKDIKSVVKELQWVDGRQFTFGDTIITYSKPLPHGPEGSVLGYVLATTIEYHGVRILFAPDIQGPIARDSLSYILSQNPMIAIIGGPPIYLGNLGKNELQSALFCLSNLARTISTLVVDHHIMRDLKWNEWLRPVLNIATESGNKIISMAGLAGEDNRCLEAERADLYRNASPSDEFLKWAQASEEYKIQHMPPL